MTPHSLEDSRAIGIPTAVDATWFLKGWNRRFHPDLPFALLLLSSLCFDDAKGSGFDSVSSPLSSPAGRDIFRRGVWGMVARALLHENAPLHRHQQMSVILAAAWSLLIRTRRLEHAVLAQIRARYELLRPEIFLRSVTFEQLAQAQTQSNAQVALAALAADECSRLETLGLFSKEDPAAVATRGLDAFAKMMRHTTREIAIGILWRRYGPFLATFFGTISSFVAAISIWLWRSETILPELIREWFVFIMEMIRNTLS